MELTGRKPASIETNIYVLANKFHCSPSEIEKMDVDDMELYLKMIQVENKLQRNGNDKSSTLHH